MSYNSLLDYYFSSVWLGLGLPVLIMIVWIIARKSGWRKSKPYSFGESILNMGITFVLIMNWGLVNPMYFGYGNARGIEDVRFENGHLVVLDFISTMGSRYEGGDPYYRIHELDPKSGDKKLRFLVGPSASYAGLHGDSVCVSRYDDAAVFSLSSGKSFAVYSKETLPKLFPEISAGVDNFMWGGQHTVMELDVLDGSKWDLYLRNGMLKRVKAGEEYNDPTVMGYEFTDREIRRTDPEGMHTLFELEGKGENDNIRYITCSNDSIPNEELSFLRGKPVALDLQDSTFIILSYETLEQKKFIVTCVGLDGKTKKWEVRSSVLEPAYELPNDETEPHFAVNPDKGLLYFNVGTTVYAVKLNDGGVVWKVKL